MDPRSLLWLYILELAWHLVGLNAAIAMSYLGQY